MNNKRYADDTVVFAGSVRAVQSIIARVNSAGIKYCLSINKQKRKIHVNKSKTHCDPKIMINNKKKY